MGQVEINNYEDLYNVLDQINEKIDWDTFYSKRNMKAPILLNNTLPDKAIATFIKTHHIENAIEFGCGEGRNAIYLAQNGIDVLAVDSSDIAIKNAKEIAQDLKNVQFVCNDFLSIDLIDTRYDLVVDSGMFHHLAPHRRLQYRDIVKKILKENGFFILLCFCSDAGGADELDDLQFYLKRNTGVSFSEQRIRNFFGSEFDIVSIEKCSQEITEEYIDIPYLYCCIMQLL